MKNHFVVHVVNPIQADSWRNSTRIRPHKTNKIDSLIIADFIRYGDFSETELASEEILEMRNLSRFRFSLVSSIGALKRQIICVLDKISPEHESVFSDVFGKTSREILTLFSSPADFEDIGADKLHQLLECVTLKRFARKKLEELSFKAKNSFGITFGIQSLTYNFSFSLLKFLLSKSKILNSTLRNCDCRDHYKRNW